MDKFKSLEIFMRVAQCGTLSGAATSLGISNATVTTAVRRLEKHLNTVLLRRDSRRLVLTEEGEHVLGQAQAIIRSMIQLENESRDRASTPSGPLHVEVPIGFGQAVLSPALPSFIERHPDITVTVTLTNEPHNLTARAVDIAVRADRVEKDDYVVYPLLIAHYVICGIPELVDRLPEDPADLDPRLCISMMPEESRHPMPWEFRWGAREVHLQPDGPLHFNNADAALAAIRSGIGIACVLDVYAASHLATGKLVRAYPQWKLRSKPCYLVTTKDNANTRKVQVFAQFLRELIAPDNRPGIHEKVNVRATL